MKTSKITVIGLLICMISIFYSDDVFMTISGLEFLPTLAFFGFPLGVIVTLIGLFKDKNDTSNK
jgi:hypothetical protein